MKQKSNVFTSAIIAMMVLVLFASSSSQAQDDPFVLVMQEMALQPAELPGGGVFTVPNPNNGLRTMDDQAGLWRPQQPNNPFMSALIQQYQEHGVQATYLAEYWTEDCRSLPIYGMGTWIRLLPDADSAVALHRDNIVQLSNQLALGYDDFVNFVFRRIVDRLTIDNINVLTTLPGCTTPAERFYLQIPVQRYLVGIIVIAPPDTDLETLYSTLFFPIFQTLEPRIEQSITDTFEANYPQQVVFSEVNGHPIYSEAFRERLRAERWFIAHEIRNALRQFGSDQVNQFYGDEIRALRDELLLGDQVLTDMELQQLLTLEAEQRGLTVDEHDVEAALQNYVVFDRANLPPDVTVDEYLANMETLLDGDLTAVWDIFYLRALRAKLRPVITAEILQQEIWVNSRHILIATDDPNCESEAEALTEAETLITRLEQGESFARLAQEYSDDPGSAQNGGELGWGASDTYVEPFRIAVEQAPIGEIVGPVCSRFGYHIIQVSERELRDISPARLENEQVLVYDAWEAQLFTNAAIQRNPVWENYLDIHPTYEELAAYWYDE